MWTATESGDYDSVRFLVQEKPIALSLGDTSLDPGEAARREDFQSLAPVNESTTTTLPGG